MSGVSRSAGGAVAAAGTVSFIQCLRRRPAAVVALAFLLALAIACMAAPLLAPYNPQAQDLTNVLSGPTARHWLGTDELGRDVLSRLLFGGRRSLLSVLEAVAVVLVLGVPFGLIAGYVGGWLDTTITRVAEVFLAVPAIVLVLVTLAVIPQNESAAMLVLGVLGAPAVLRVVRGGTLRVRHDLYIDAARVSGVSHARILTRHVLPRIKGPIIIQGFLFAAVALLFETGLGYLGLAASPLTPTWGGMVAEASAVLTRQRWLLYPPGVTIGLTILALGILGDAVRDAVGSVEGAEQPARRWAPAPAPPASPESTAGPAGLDREAVLDVRHLTVALADTAGSKVIVEDVSLSVGPGETVGLLGESGCGKSMTALAILRLLPPSASISAGRVGFAGQDITAMPGRAFDRLRATGLGYVSQEPMTSLDPTWTVGSQLGEVVRRHDGGTRHTVRDRVHELLAHARISAPEAVARAYPHELSGGMAQRVAIAMALAGRPRLLIADEPTTALDVTVQSQILDLLRDLQRQNGMAILLVTHDWGVVADLCHRAVVMYAGQTVEKADVQALFDEPLHPYTRGLLQSNPAAARPGQQLPSMPGRVPPPGAWPAGCRFAPRCPLATGDCRGAAIPAIPSGAGRESRCIHTGSLRDRAGAPT